MAPKSAQLRWLEQAVACGRVPSVEAAVEDAIAARMADPDGFVDGDWVAPCLAEARAEAARGETMSMDEFKAHMALRRTNRADLALVVCFDRTRSGKTQVSAPDHPTPNGSSIEGEGCVNHSAPARVMTMWSSRRMPHSP